MLALTDVEPMLLAERRPPVPTPGWIYELKYDGYRVMARIDHGGHVDLRSRKGYNCTRWYPEVAAGLAQLHGQHLLDGEVCVLDEFGRSDFARLHVRSRRRKWYAGAAPVAFLAFDLLAFRGVDVRGWPLERRKEALQQLLTPAPPAVLYVSHLDSDGDQLYANACALQLEGIVCKRLGSPYADGQRNGDWLKVKRPGAVPPERFKRVGRLGEV
jgi:bifunctional non-homologous end joining protein LigD